MKYYKISAEHVTNTKLNKILAELDELDHGEVMAAGMDEIFDRQIVIIMFGPVELKDEVRNIVWKYNKGAWCEQVEISEQEADDHC